jgi:vacuolar-type H+-ATPase subunit I/STV1
VRIVVENIEIDRMSWRMPLMLSLIRLRVGLALSLLTKLIAWRTGSIVNSMVSRLVWSCMLLVMIVALIVGRKSTPVVMVLCHMVVLAGSCTLVPCRIPCLIVLSAMLLSLEVMWEKRLWSLGSTKVRTLPDGKLLSSRRGRQFACHRPGRRLETNPYRKSLCVCCM